jgi:hypothetical protein
MQVMQMFHMDTILRNVLLAWYHEHAPALKKEEHARAHGWPHIQDNPPEIERQGKKKVMPVTLDPLLGFDEGNPQHDRDGPCINAYTKSVFNGKFRYKCDNYVHRYDRSKTKVILRTYPAKYRHYTTTAQVAVRQ